MWVGKGRKGEGERANERRRQGLAGLQNCRLLVSLKLKMGDVCIKKGL